MAIKSHTVNTSIPAGTALSLVFEIAEFNEGILHMPTTAQAWTAADIGFEVSDAVGGVYQPLYNASGLVVISGPVVDRSYLLPVDLAGARFIKLWSNTAASDTNQVAVRLIRIDIKAS